MPSCDRYMGSVRMLAADTYLSIKFSIRGHKETLEYLIFDMCHIVCN